MVFALLQFDISYEYFLKSQVKAFVLWGVYW